MCAAMLSKVCEMFVRIRSEGVSLESAFPDSAVPAHSRLDADYGGVFTELYALLRAGYVQVCDVRAAMRANRAVTEDVWKDANAWISLAQVFLSMKPSGKGLRYRVYSGKYGKKTISEPLRQFELPTNVCGGAGTGINEVQCNTTLFRFCCVGHRIRMMAPKDSDVQTGKYDSEPHDIIGNLSRLFPASKFPDQNKVIQLLPEWMSACVFAALVKNKWAIGAIPFRENMTTIAPQSAAQEEEINVEE